MVFNIQLSFALLLDSLAGLGSKILSVPVEVFLSAALKKILFFKIDLHLEMFVIVKFCLDISLHNMNM